MDGNYLVARLPDRERGHRRVLLDVKNNSVLAEDDYLEVVEPLYQELRVHFSVD